MNRWPFGIGVFVIIVVTMITLRTVMLRKVKTVRKRRPKNGIRDARHALHVAPRGERIVFSGPNTNTNIIRVCKFD